MKRDDNNGQDRSVVIVTGASSGIGAATARRLARDGMRVTLAARREGRLEAIAAQIAADRGEALVVPTDVRDRAAIQRMVEATRGRWGRIDVLVNNAGLGGSGHVAQLDPEKLREQVEVNLLGVIQCAQAVLPVMMSQRSGHIINIASIAGLVGIPGSSVYSATKFGVVGFSEGLYREVRGHGIHVTAFCPGFVAAAFSPRLEALREAQTSRRLPGVMRAEYVAERIVAVIRHPRRRVIIPRGWGFLVWIARTFPQLTDVVFDLYLRRQDA